MKPATETISTVSTVAGNAQVMGIDASGMGTVLSILSNMYSDGSLAVVREYASNALDSHIEAGNKEPILITSPTHFNPVLTVQDFGTGLSHDEVLNVYAMYGASTKRDSNEQIGAFGIGAKSAFTVGTQFTVTAVKDGMETIALFALNDDGAPTVNILSQKETLEPNGVKVEVGVRDVDGVNRAIERLFPTWEKGTVLIDGVEPASIWEELTPLADDIHLGWLVQNAGTPSWVVVMGGIPYELPDAVISSLSGRQRQVARNVKMSKARAFLTVPIGAVDITPSREELRVTPKTTAAIDSLITKFENAIGPWVEGVIADASSLIGAILMYNDLKSKLGIIASSTLVNVRWQGKAIPASAVELSDTDWFRLRDKRGYYGDRVAARSRGLEIRPDGNLGALTFITNVPERRVRTVQRAAKKYLMAQEGTVRISKVVALTSPEASYADDWFDLSDPALVKFDFTTFTSEWKPPPTPSQHRSETLYDMSDGTSENAADLVKMGEVYYLSHDDRNLPFRQDILLRAAIGGKSIVTLKPTQRVSALKRRVPNIISAHQKMREVAQKLLDGFTEDDADALAAENFQARAERQHLGFLIDGYREITNTVVLLVIERYIAALELKARDTSRMQLLKAAARFLGHDLATIRKSGLTLDDWNNTLGKLPLLAHYLETPSWRRSTLSDEHAIMYVNAVTL